MQGRFSGQSSVLERAQRQLQGQRLTASSAASRGRSGNQERRKDDNDLNAYLSRLSHKVSQASGKQTKSSLTDDLSNLSISSDEDGGHKGTASLSASRFVKKSHSQTLDDSGSLRRKNETLAAGSPLKKSATSPSFLNRSAPVYASAALQKAAQLGAKFAKQKRSAETLRGSESDFNVSLSDDDGDRALKSKGRGGVIAGSSKEKLQTSQAKKASSFSYLQSSDEDEPKRDGSKFLKKSAKPSFYISESDDEDNDKIGRDGNKFLKKSASSKPSSAVADVDVAKNDGSRFLKKSAKQTPVQETGSAEVEAKADNDAFPPKAFSHKSDFLTSTPKKASDTRPGTSKLSRTAPAGAKFGLDSDEEDLQEFIMNLSPSSTPDIPPARDRKPAARTSDIESQRPAAVRSAPGRRPATPAAKRASAPREEDSQSAVSESPSSIVTESANDEDEDNDFFSGIHTNIMQLEDLEPVGISVKAAGVPSSKPKASAGKSEHEDIADAIGLSEQDSIREDVFAGLQTVDDLLARETSEKRDQKHAGRKDSYQSDFESANEIATEAEQSVSEILSEVSEALRRSGSKTPGEVYAEDTFASQSEPPSETRTSTRTVPDSHSATSEEDTRRRVSRAGSDSRRSGTKASHSYSDDFHSGRTDSEVEDLSTDDNDRTRTESVTHSKSYTSYTESRTVTRSETRPRRGKRKGRRKGESRDAAVQADGATSTTHHWLRDLDLSALGSVTGSDPTPVAMHVINPQALEALTSYSPSILAMNETLLSQLRHTQETVRAALRLHQSLVENIETDFSYTTLEDTREYIRQHRRPKLTMEEALEEVQREMEEGYR